MAPATAVGPIRDRSVPTWLASPPFLMVAKPGDFPSMRIPAQQISIEGVDEWQQSSWL